MKVDSIIIIIRVVPPLTTPPINPLNSLMCSKGVIQRLKIVLVKTHDGLTFYEYKTHTESRHTIINSGFSFCLFDGNFVVGTYCDVRSSSMHFQYVMTQVS